MWTNAALGNYWPDASILGLAALPERVVRQRYGPEPGHDRYNYITPDFAIGSVSANHGAQDNQISVSLPSELDEKVPFIEYTADSLDAPYGHTKEKDKSGHVKPHKLKNLIAAVQDKGVVLALTDLSEEAAKETMESIATNLIVPSTAEAIYLDEQKVDASLPFDLPASVNSVVYVRQGNAAVALRIFAADGVDGQTPSFGLKYDGNEWNAARLVAYHYRGPAKKHKDKAVRAGFLIIAASCPTDDSFDKFMHSVRKLEVTQKSEGDQWSAQVTYGTVKLEAGLDLKQQEIAFRHVHGQDPASQVLDLNGADYATKLLGVLPTPLDAPEKYVTALVSTVR
jgi:hypothetical protein